MILHSDEHSTFHHGDCREVMRALAVKSVDVIIVDPPYSQHVHECNRSGHTGYDEAQSSQKATYSRSRDLGFAYLSSELRQAAAAEFARLSKRWVVVFLGPRGGLRLGTRSRSGWIGGRSLWRVDQDREHPTIHRGSAWTRARSSRHRASARTQALERRRATGGVLVPNSCWTEVATGRVCTRRRSRWISWRRWCATSPTMAN